MKTATRTKKPDGRTKTRRLGDRAGVEHIADDSRPLSRLQVLKLLASKLYKDEAELAALQGMQPDAFRRVYADELRRSEPYAGTRVDEALTRVAAQVSKDASLWAFVATRPAKGSDDDDEKRWNTPILQFGEGDAKL